MWERDVSKTQIINSWRKVCVHTHVRAVHMWDNQHENHIKIKFFARAWICHSQQDNKSTHFWCQPLILKSRVVQCLLNCHMMMSTVICCTGLWIGDSMFFSVAIRLELLICTSLFSTVASTATSNCLTQQKRNCSPLTVKTVRSTFTSLPDECPTCIPVPESLYLHLMSVSKLERKLAG